MIVCFLYDEESLTGCCLRMLKNVKNFLEAYGGHVTKFELSGF